MEKLLNREDFKKQVFERQNGKCLMCDSEAVDAHHILDRKLFKNGGYYLNNGVALCSKHHLDAENSVDGFLPHNFYDMLGICEIPFPENFKNEIKSKIFNKWGEEMIFLGYNPKWYEKYK